MGGFTVIMSVPCLFSNYLKTNRELTLFLLSSFSLKLSSQIVSHKKVIQ